MNILLDTIDRQKAEIDRLRVELAEANRHIAEMQPELGKLRSELDRLHALNEELVKRIAHIRLLVTNALSAVNPDNIVPPAP